MADGKDVHTALDNPGVWQRPDCCWPCRMFFVFFERKSFLEWQWYLGHLPPEDYLKENETYSTPALGISIKLVFPSTRWRDSCNNYATVPRRIGLVDLKKKQEMQKVIFHILLLYVFVKKLAHPPYKWDLQAVLHWPRTERCQAFGTAGQNRDCECSLWSGGSSAPSYTEQTDCLVPWGHRNAFFSSSIDKFQVTFSRQCSERDRGQANTSLACQAL